MRQAMRIRASGASAAVRRRRLEGRQRPPRGLRVGGAIAANLLIGACCLGAAAPEAQVKWHMPTPYSDGEFHTRNAIAFADDVKRLTNGEVEIRVHPNGSLVAHPDMLRELSRGQVPIGEFLLGQFGAEDLVFAADNLPFVAAGYDNALRFYQAQRPFLEKSLAARHLRLLYSVPWPGQGVYTRGPLRNLEDLQGIPFRVYSPQTSRMAELLGARPVMVQASEIQSAFAGGRVRAMMTSSATGVDTRAWRFATDYYKTSAFLPKNVVVVTERAFATLTEDPKLALTRAAAEAEARGWTLSRARERECDEALAKGGLRVREPDAAMKAAFAKVGQAMFAEWRQAAGAAGDGISRAYAAGAAPRAHGGVGQ